MELKSVSVSRYYFTFSKGRRVSCLKFSACCTWGGQVKLPGTEPHVPSAPLFPHCPALHSLWSCEFCPWRTRERAWGPIMLMGRSDLEKWHEGPNSQMPMSCITEVCTHIPPCSPWLLPFTAVPVDHGLALAWSGYCRSPNQSLSLMGPPQVSPWLNIIHENRSTPRLELEAFSHVPSLTVSLAVKQGACVNQHSAFSNYIIYCNMKTE